MTRLSRGHEPRSLTSPLMASAEDPDRDASAAPETDGQCLPCRGTGQVISYLGGGEERVSCPWCGGTGTRQAGIDAQARWQPAPASDGA